MSVGVSFLVHTFGLVVVSLHFSGTSTISRKKRKCKFKKNSCCERSFVNEMLVSVNLLHVWENWRCRKENVNTAKIENVWMNRNTNTCTGINGIWIFHCIRVETRSLFHASLPLCLLWSVGVCYKIFFHLLFFSFSFHVRWLVRISDENI